MVGLSCGPPHGLNASARAVSHSRKNRSGGMAEDDSTRGLSSVRHLSSCYSPRVHAPARSFRVNGVLVAGLDAPSRSAARFAHPPDLQKRYAEVFDRYVIEPGAKSLMGAGRPDEAVNELMGAVDGWASLTDRLMRDEEWDLCFV